MAGSTAGESAAERARELRAKAAKLEEQARHWEKGAEGERRTAAVLSSLTQHGYVVLDDLSIPGSKANIDHVVVGPTGVIVIETKAYSGRLKLRNGVLWHGRYPLRRELEAARFEADKVREAVASTGWPVMVRSLMCIHSDSVPHDSDGQLAPIELCSPLDLLTRIKAAPELLAPEHVSRLAQVIETALPPRVVAAPPGQEREVASERSVGLVLPLPARSGRSRWQGYATRAARGLDRLARRVLAAIVVFIAFVLALAVVAAIANKVLEDMAPETTTTTTTTAPQQPTP